MAAAEAMEVVVEEPMTAQIAADTAVVGMMMAQAAVAEDTTAMARTARSSART